MVLGALGFHMQNFEMRSLHYALCKNQLKMLKDLIKTPGSIKLLEENMEEVPQDIILCENFRVRLQKHRQ